MRFLLSLLLLGLLGIVHALHSSGGRLLVVIEEATEKEKYSTFWGDLEGERTLLQQHPQTSVEESMAKMHHNSSWIPNFVRIAQK